MCKRCSELEIEIEAAEEYGFGLTSFQLQEELEALQASHLPNNRVQLTGATCPTHNEPVSDLIHYECGCSTTRPRN